MLRSISAPFRSFTHHDDTQYEIPARNRPGAILKRAREHAFSLTTLQNVYVYSDTKSLESLSILCVSNKRNEKYNSHPRLLAESAPADGEF